MNTFAAKRVWTAQHRSRDVKQSVWEPVFLHVMIEILQDGSWKEYPHEVWDRTCKFSAVEDFLTSEDGLGWPDIQATCAMIRNVANSRAAVSIRLDTKTTLRDLASQLLAELATHGVDEVSAGVPDAREDPIPGHGTQYAQGEDGRFRSRLTEAIEDARQNPLANPGGNPGTEAYSISFGTEVLTSGDEHGTSRRYLLRRIARDCPELLNDIGPGKPYRSAHAAAIAAGIVRDIPTVRLTDPTKAAATVLQKQGREWAAQMAAALTELLTEEAGDE